MTKMTRATAIQHAQQAARGSLSSLADLLRSLVDDKVGDHPVPGPGITDGTDTLYKSSVHRRGDIIVTTILLNMDGLKSATSDLDIIGEAVTGDDAHLGQITNAINGTILAGKITCLEAPADLTDVDFYSATVSTGEHEDGIAALDEVALVTKGGAWSIDDVEALTGLPRNLDYLYVVNGASDTAVDFTVGIFLIELYGYDA